MLIDQILKSELTPEQYNAVVDNSKEILCLACAGSGKSRTLAYRIAKLISDNNPPESIVAFTFTDKAADSIKRRVADALIKTGTSPTLVGAMFIGTIHSYCQHLLGEMDAKYRQFDVLDDNKLKLYLLSRYPKLGLQHIKSQREVGQFAVISEVSNAWKLANDELLSFEKISEEDPLLGRSLQDLYDGLNADQYIDFSLMIRLVVEALERNDPAINKALQNIRHLLVDEYQDVNRSQEALINGIYERIDSLLVVGDDDQAIYGWRGADVRNIIEFEQRYQNATTHTLATNFRSTTTIVETADAFIKAELAALRINKNPVSHSDGNIEHFGNLWFDNREEEAIWIANRIKQLLGTKYIEKKNDGTEIERGLTKADFAILMRSVLGGTRSGNPPHHTEFTNALSSLEIGYTIEAEGGIFNRPHAIILRDTMELLREDGVSREDVKALFKTAIINHFPNADFNALTHVISAWNTKIHTPAGGARRKVYPQELVHDLLHAFGVHKTSFDDDVLRDLGVFSSIILDVEKVFVSIDDSWRFQNILNFLSNVAESGYDASTLDLVARPDAVTISTVHKMKGLEFPVVFIVDVIHSRFPKNNSSYSGWLPHTLLNDALERGLFKTDNYGEARLFYTALTRAERILYITGSQIQPGLKNPKKPSRFKLRIAHDNIVTNQDSLPEHIQKVPEKRRIDDNSMPTSFTEIKDFLECPMKYKYRKILGFSPSVPELFGFGLTTHTAINKLHQHYPNTTPSKDDAESIVDEVFHLKHVFPSNSSERKGPYENAKEKAKEIVSRYAENYPQDFIQNRQVEQSFEIKAGNALITGAIDLLLKEDENGQILESKVIDFKSMDYPDENDVFFWINLSLQVQLYSHASRIVLGENAKAGAVHLLKANPKNGLPERVDIPVNVEAIDSAIANIEWAVNRILNQEFPKRPSALKCGTCDYNRICSKIPEYFQTEETPPPIHIPESQGNKNVMVRAFSDFEN